MAQAARSLDTRQRLLDAAVEVFAEEGYRQATLQEISRRAGTNIAAANYHFGGKDRLYAAVFEYAERRTRPEPQPSPAETAEERLRGHVVSFLSRLLDPQRPAWFARLLAREMVEPTRALDRLVRRRMRANHAQLSTVVRELLGPAATDERVRFCTLSVIAQCVFYRNSAAVLTRLYPDLVPAREVAAIARHVSDFSLAAIRGLRADGSNDGRRRR